MQPIDLKQLEHVVGGAGGAILGGLLKAAPGILNGVAGIVGAAKSGGGGGGQAAAAGPPPGAQMASAPVAGGGGGDPMVSVSVSINGVRQA